MHRISVGDDLHHGRLGDDAPAPDRVPRQCVLTTEVEDATVTQFDREGDRLAEGVVPEHDRLVDAPGRTPRLAPARCRSGVRVGVDGTYRRVGTSTCSGSCGD